MLRLSDFNLDGTSYEFTTDRFGRRVTFTPLADKRPDRVVLIDFWGTWCGPCVAATRELVEMYEKYHARGLEVIGVDSGDTREHRDGKFVTGPDTGGQNLAAEIAKLFPER